MSTLFVNCPACGVNKIPVSKDSTSSCPHGLCLQCLGQDHDPFKCTTCMVMDKRTISRREVQRRVWIHSGVFLSRAKASVYIKTHNLYDSFKQGLDLSFKSLNLSQASSAQPSPPAVDILAQGTAPEPTPLISYGETVTGF